MSFSIPAFTALLKLNALGLSFNPTLVVSDVGSDAITLSGLLQAFAAQNTRRSTATADPGHHHRRLPAVAGHRQHQHLDPAVPKIHTQYIPKLPFDGNVAYGMSVAYTFVQAMEKAGKNPTRQDLINAIKGGISQGASVAPYAYSSTNHLGGTGAYMGTIQNGVLVPQGPVLITDTSPTGAITPYTTTQPLAPASGIPSP